ncbi:hypothetical protein L6452_16366 [Arctium lappa]|uniref:Uncharacterized protein n=1 Tax=Arctium lappa TaxID=4217 RepID=A0ACB9C0A1_ARCLA|nr:hypothetical protein L6452_16366 [Arctium lappa]
MEAKKILSPKKDPLKTLNISSNFQHKLPRSFLHLPSISSTPSYLTPHFTNHSKTSSGFQLVLGENSNLSSFSSGSQLVFTIFLIWVSISLGEN